MMKNKTIILLILLLISLGTNIYLFSRINKFQEDDKKQLEIFSEVSDSLDSYRLKYRSDWQEN